MHVIQVYQIWQPTTHGTQANMATDQIQQLAKSVVTGPPSSLYCTYSRAYSSIASILHPTLINKSSRSYAGREDSVSLLHQLVEIKVVPSDSEGDRKPVGASGQDSDIVQRTDGSDCGGDAGVSDSARADPC